MQMKLEITGTKEFDDLLQQLPAAVQQRAAGTALRAGGRIARDAAKRYAPIGDPSESVADYGVGSRARALSERGRGGRLRRSIRVITARNRKRNTTEVIVITSQREAGINPHWIEFGTGPRMAKNADGLLTFVVDGKLIRKRSVAGVAAQPFMRPAFDTNVGSITAAIEQALGAGIEREAKRLAGRLRPVKR